MPEYLAPGVYVEETSFRAKSIEGVSTTTTGFVGPTRYGPLDLEPEIITSVVEFERIYGDRAQFEFDGLPPMHNYMWHAVRAFFEEGGKRLYIARAFTAKPGDTHEGRAFGNPTPPIGGSAAAASLITLRSRFPGSAGNMKVRLTLHRGQNVASIERSATAPDKISLSGLRDRDVVMIGELTTRVLSPPPIPLFYVAVAKTNPITNEINWEFHDDSGGRRLQSSLMTGSPPQVEEVRVVTLSVTTMQADGGGAPGIWSGLALDDRHKIGGSFDSFGKRFVKRPENGNDARNLPFYVELDSSLDTGRKLLIDGFFAIRPDLQANLSKPEPSDAERSIYVDLENGNDGTLPAAAAYEGKAEDARPEKTGLKALEDLEDISIVAAPGATFGMEDNESAKQRAQAINLQLISHAERMRYRIAVLDSGNGQSISAVRAMRAMMDSKYAAFYYPWVKVLDPVTRQEIVLPPSGFVTGIYARNDIERAVYKAPANEVVRGAIGFEITLNKAQQEVLNPEGINCFRFFEGRGFRLWGARTISSDPEWKYLNLRRYFAYLERSIDKGTQWAVFEPNGEQLWANVRRTVEDFLLNEWANGALLGDKPEKSFFVKCDRSTMSQNDLDNGRMVCLVGLVPLRPAEFVIFRVGQWTADRKI